MKAIVKMLLFVFIFNFLFSYDSTSKADQSIDGIVSEQEYPHKSSYQNGDYELFWRIEDDIATIAMKAKTLGWVSLGIDPEIKMKNADIIFGWVDKDGNAVIFDAFCSVEVGPHPTDEEQGGTNDILSFAGKEIGNFTTIEFSRRLNTGDDKDKVIPNSGNLKIIISYGAVDEFKPRHIFRSTEEIEINPVTEKYIEINVQQAKELYDKANNLQILDVSSVWNDGHIPGSINIPYNELTQNLDKLDRKKATLVYCHIDSSSIFASNILVKNGFKPVFRLLGNYKAWVDAGYPIEKSAAKMIIKFKIGSLTYWIGNVSKLLDSPPVVIEGRTLLPIRYLAEAIGAKINWEAQSRKITIELNQTTIILVIGQNSAVINGKVVKIDPDNPNVKPIVVPPGRTLLPLRFVAEQLNCQVSWNQKTQEITITYPK